MTKALALIPARGGSKGIPRKNLLLLDGHPLVAWAIAAARMSKEIGTVVVSSDDGEILQVADDYGANPLERPPMLATDHATDAGVIAHARRVYGWNDLVVYLRPTTPLRDPGHIDQAVRRLRATPGVDGLRSVHAAPESPLKWFESDEDGLLVPLSGMTNQSRQRCATAWIPNGYVDVFRFARPRRLIGYAIHGIELDDWRTFDYLRRRLSTEPSPLAGFLDVKRAVTV